MAEPVEKKPEKESPETKGWLYKWTNYIKGYQKRWFVLQNGLLSYYRNQAEMAHTCRGTISLHGAIIHTENYSCNFVVSNGGGTQTFHLRASSEVERQKWVTALELAKAKAIQMMESDEEDEGDQEFPVEISKQELLNAVRGMSNKLEDLRTCNDLIVKHGHALQRSVSDLEQGTGSIKDGGDRKADVASIQPRVKILNERATLFKITSNAMINASTEYLELTQTQGKKWQRLLSHEREQRLRLEEMVEQLARQHSQLEHQCKKTNYNTMERTTNHNHKRTNSNVSHASTAPDSSSATTNTIKDEPKSSDSISNSEDEDDFHDAVTDPEYVDFTVSCAPAHRRTTSNVSAASTRSDGATSHREEETDYSSDQEDAHTLNIVKKREKKREDLPDGDKNNKTTTPVKRASGRERRSRIPDKPDISFSLWSVMKNCIGKDLSKIAVPVNFSEPISFLQRLCEDFEYSEILDRAAGCSDDHEQMALVAAFTVSSYSSTAIRAGKPFNPLLNETFEFDRREDLGWRCIAEQVLHHPPMVAQYCESEQGGGWRCWQEFTMRSKFKGKYLEVEPLGITHLEFKNSGNHYTWRKVKTVVHNIVIGKLWIDQHGEMEVVNHTKGDKCYMKFEPYSYFGGTPKKVTGTITNLDGKVEWVLNGTWDSKMEGSNVIGEAMVKGKSSLEIGASKVLWKKNPMDPQAEKYYNFSKFTCELNELEDYVAPTDSRHRPDQRLMEEGRWDEANTEKVRLEEKQRATRRQREIEAELAQQEGREYEAPNPTWYRAVPDQFNNGKLIHEYQGGYWEAKDTQEWVMCPDIF
eukprot:GFUD01032953.1.p1 GENE.GFUD01032953.1~~GFUD01032953.1.p1  ORF type:complete len:811 (+),score=205.19 GFUD01032953.1:488-2920(+)